MPMLPKLNKSNQPWPELNTKMTGKPLTPRQEEQMSAQVPKFHKQ